MTRCDNEGVFYRVFCVGLLIIAFTFTVILTNVFIDIDGLLSKKERESSGNQSPRHVTENYERTSDPQEYYGGERNEDINSAYRTKRSLDSPDFLLHIKNPKMKSILTHRLATLLEELDEEEDTAVKRDKNNQSQDSNDIYVRTDNAKAAELKEIEEVIDEKGRRNNDEMLHAAMHNILLKGVIGHMDLNEVYKKVHALVRSFKNKQRIDKEKKLAVDEYKNEAATESIQPTTPLNEEMKFFEELVNCKKLQQEIVEVSTEKTTTKITQKALEVSRNRKPNITSPKFFIKTLIDIQKNDKELDKNSKENVKGIIRLIYNGKSIKIRSMDEEETPLTTTPTTVETTTTTTTTTTASSDVEIISEMLKQNFGGRDIPRSYVNSVLVEYLSKYKKSETSEQPIKYTEKRLKRNIKLHHIKETKRFKKPTKKKDDDELYVEIETHFDNKGLKGKKKKELIKQLIEKIQTAIHSNQEIINQKKPVNNRRDQEIHIRKRTQSSLAHTNDNNTIISNKNSKNMLSYDANMYREQAPISKVEPILNPLPRVSDENGQDWRRKETGPKFFSTSKSINSAELSQVDVDVNKVMTLTGIPQRLQVPLNTDTEKNVSEESPNAYLDLGNLQFMIKDIEGSGFSIGLNQYVDHAPDPESMKLFTGIESLVNTYHQTYDQNNPEYPKPAGIAVLKHEMKKRDVEVNKQENLNQNEDKDRHIVKKRSVDQGIQGSDYHSNEYKIIFDEKFLPYDNYQEIYEHKQKRVSLPIHKLRKKEKLEVKENKSDVVSDLDNIFEQKLKPSEIFDLASFLDRKKRSHSVQKIMNLNTKIRLNRFINTKAMPKQKFFFKSKRNKRQIGKIRIIAKDMKGQSGSDENIFIVSDENMYADRAVVSRTDVPDSQEEKVEETSEYEPSVFEETKPRVFALENKVRHNTLMAKYPHVFVEDEPEDIATPLPSALGRVFIDPHSRKTEAEVFDDHDGMIEERMPKVQDLVHALVPYPKANYKVTVKLLPKEENDTRSGFKEVHTSINKTVNKNGLLYSSLVNVSEISKIEASNGTDNQAGFINALQSIGIPYHNINTLEHKDVNNNVPRETTTPPVVENKHDELTRMLQAQKESIDNHFNKLKDKIHKMTRTKTTEPPDEHKELMEILAISQPSVASQNNMNKDYISEILCKHLKEKDATITTTTTTTATTPTPTTTTATTTTAPTTMKLEVVDALRMKLLSAISQNERLTSRILNKIDQNTDILQTFLAKITDKIQSIPDLTKAINNKMKEDNHAHEHEHTVNAHPVFLRQPDNNTDVPFIYAYKPCRPSVKMEAPVASIVYQVPKTLPKHEAIHVSHPTDVKVNFDFDTLIQKDNTRYFIDEDYFKTVANPDNKAGEEPKKDDKHKMHDNHQNAIGVGAEHNTINHQGNPGIQDHNPMNHQGTSGFSGDRNPMNHQGISGITGDHNAMNHAGISGISVDRNPMNHQGIPGISGDRNNMNHPGMGGIPVEHNMVQPLKSNVNMSPFRYKSNAPAPKQNFNMTKVM